MSTSTHFWPYPEQFLLDWGMLQAKVIEKIKTHILCSVTFFFRKPFRLWDNVGKCCTAGQVTDGNTARRMGMAWWIATATDTLTICNAYYLSTATMVVRTLLSVWNSCSSTRQHGITGTCVQNLIPSVIWTATWADTVTSRVNVTPGYAYLTTEP